MRCINTFFVFLSIVTIPTRAQDTFSIVAADSATREVGSAGASCVDLYNAGITDATFIGDLLSDTGAINSQAYYLSANQNNARTRMREGDNPQQIISWLIANDVQSNPAIRQYGIVGFSGNNLTAEGYTGNNCNDYKNHKTGSINGIYYSIQGNILLGQQVIDSMESRLRNEHGDLACRLMAALQGAKMVGADTRCSTNNSSSLFAYVKVAQATDTYGSPSFSQSVKTHNGDHIEPIDSLQNIFNAVHNCDNTGIAENELNNIITIYPNPVNNNLTIETPIKSGIEIINEAGQIIRTVDCTESITTIDITDLLGGAYFIKVKTDEGISMKKFIKE